MSVDKKMEKKVILVVEDDGIGRTLLKEMLKNKGIEIHFAKNGQEAIAFFSKNPVPNIVLMDIRLPDTTGIELTKILIREYPHINIVAQTAYATPEVEEECYSIGMKAFLTKPLRASAVERVLEKLL